MNETYFVFVYGTLRKDEANHYLLKEASCLARECWTYGILYDTGCGYPAMVQDKSQKVYGELYEVNANQLQKLDWLEGYEGEGMSNDYERMIQSIYTNSGSLEAYVYIYSPHKAEELTKITDGDWKQRS
jgi:gamma-glutamylcyclotransferase (GGCT)/AIG2-like uncharacterized protein YtfP